MAFGNPLQGVVKLMIGASPDLSQLKIDAEKGIEKWYQHDAKTMPELMPTSMKNHTFLKKAEMLETICFTIEDVVPGT